MVLLGQKMLRRAGDLDSQSRGLYVMAQLFQTDRDNGFMMHVFEYADELGVEEDIEEIAGGTNAALANQAQRVLVHFHAMDKEALVEETAMRRREGFSF